MLEASRLTFLGAIIIPVMQNQLIMSPICRVRGSVRAITWLFESVLRLFNGKLCVFKHRLDLKGYATQMPGTATFWKRCGEATAEDG
jgi:hypothetical protein